MLSEETSSKKTLGRKTGWCNSPSSDDPKASHAKCDGIWNINKDGETSYCPCDCHDKQAAKAKNAKKYKRELKPKKKKTKVVEACSEHPTYGGIRRPRKECETCWELYYQKNPDKKAIAAQAR